MIKLKNLLGLRCNENVGEVPKFLYHITFKHLLPSIQKFGLKPNQPTLPSGKKDKYAVYLATRKVVAGDYLQMEKFFVDEEDLVLLIINTAGLSEKHYIRDEEFLYYGIIPPKNIIEIIPLENIDFEAAEDED